MNSENPLVGPRRKPYRGRHVRHGHVLAGGCFSAGRRRVPADSDHRPG